MIRKILASSIIVKQACLAWLAIALFHNISAATCDANVARTNNCCKTCYSKCTSLGLSDKECADTCSDRIARQISCEYPYLCNATLANQQPPTGESNCCKTCYSKCILLGRNSQECTDTCSDRIARHVSCEYPYLCDAALANQQPPTGESNCCKTCYSKCMGFGVSDQECIKTCTDKIARHVSCEYSTTNTCYNFYTAVDDCATQARLCNFSCLGRGPAGDMTSLCQTSCFMKSVECNIQIDQNGKHCWPNLDPCMNPFCSTLFPHN